MGPPPLTHRRYHAPHCHLCSITITLQYSTRYSRGRGGLYGLLFAVLALIPERGCRADHSPSSLSLNQAHIYSLALFTSNSCVPSRHRWFSLSSQPIALGESGADVHGGPRRSSGESVSSASSSSKVSMGVSQSRTAAGYAEDRLYGAEEPDANPHPEAEPTLFPWRPKGVTVR